MQRPIIGHHFARLVQLVSPLNGIRDRRLQYLIAAACAIVLVTGMFRLMVPQALNGPDFLNAYNAGSAIRDGQNPYETAAEFVTNYKPGDPLGNHLYFFTYAPAYAILLIPLTLLPFQAALLGWELCITGFLVLAIYCVLRSMGMRPTPLLILVTVSVASVASSVRAEVFLGEANMFMLACICFAIYARLNGRTRLGGLALSLVFAIKPTMLLLTPFFLWKREFRLVFTSLAGFAVLLFLPFVWLGTQTFADLAVMWRFFSTTYLTFIENISPRGILERLFTVNPFVQPVLVAPWLAVLLWLSIALFLALVCLSLIRPRPFQRNPRSMLELGAILCTLLLISPLTEPTYLLYLIVPLMATLGYVSDGRVIGRGTRLLVISTVVGVCIVQAIPRGVLEPSMWVLAAQDAPLAGLYAVFAVSQFYILLAVYILQIALLSVANHQPVGSALSTLIRQSPRLTLEWLHDFVVAARLPGSHYTRRLLAVHPELPEAIS